MNNRVSALQDKLISLKKQINKTREISSRRPIDLTTLGELWNDSLIPPYAITTITAYKLGPEMYSDLTEEPENGRVRSKFEKGVNKTFAAICSGVFCAVTVPLVALIDSTYSLPSVAVLGIQSAIYTNYNKNIEKAKEKLKELEAQYDKTLEEFNIARQEEKEANLEF